MFTVPLLSNGVSSGFEALGGDIDTACMVILYASFYVIKKKESRLKDKVVSLVFGSDYYYY
jgi:hypothetical protein